jgi:hypothetical protein
LSDVFIVDSYVVDLDQYISTIELYTYKSSFFDRHLVVKMKLAHTQKVSGIMEIMKSNHVTAKKTLHDFIFVRKAAENVFARKRRVEEEPDISVNILSLEVRWSKKKVVVMDPDHFTIVHVLKECLNVGLIEVLVGMPQFGI